MIIVLHTPEIPPNTGNIARLCAATQTPLHLIEPLGFSLDERSLKRAGLDYWPHVSVTVWPDFAAFLEKEGTGRRLIAASARGGDPLHTFRYEKDDALVFGCETKGLPESVFNACQGRVRIPIWGKVRSLNLSTSAGILLYQALASTGQLEGL